MKTSILATFVAALAAPLFAAGPAPLPDKGKILILDNDELIEGDIERVGERFRVRRAAGELFIPAARVTGLVNDRDAAFLALKERAKLSDANEHLRLARWCLSHQLPKRAIEEADAAASLNPNDVRFRMAYCEPIKRQAAIMPAKATAAKDAAAAVANSPAPTDVATVDVSPESLALFVTKIQPILMNTCATCHSAGRGGKFQLVRVQYSGAANKEALQNNLAAVSSFFNREQPGSSPLLVKAVSVHGSSGLPPIKDRQAGAYRHLEAWAYQAAGQPGLPAPLPAATVAAAAPLPAKESKANEFASEAPAPVTAGSPATQPVTPAAAKQSKPPAKPQTGPGDPFDPDIFNQQTGSPPKK